MRFMITIEQIKAARALLGWSQKNLADRAGYALPTLNNIERGLATGRPQTMQHIQEALEQAGVEFLEQTGVRLVKEVLEIKMLDGQSCLKELYDDIFFTVDADGGEILLSGIEEEKFMEFDSLTMLNHIKNTGHRPDIRHKLLFRHGDTNILGSEIFKGITPEHKNMKARYTEWRWLPENLFGLVSMIIYGDKYATILWGDHVRIIITKNRSITETFRKQFMAIWDIAEKIPDHLLLK